MGRPDPHPGRRLTAIAFVGLLLIAQIAVASPDAQVAIDVGVVVASHDGPTIDPELSSIRNQLQSMFNYSSYRMIDRLKRTLPWTKRVSSAFPAGVPCVLLPSPPRETR